MNFLNNKPKYGISPTDRLKNFVIEDCTSAVSAGRCWHVVTSGYCFPFDEKREFIWHASEVEHKELLLDQGWRVKGFKHDSSMHSFNETVAQRPDLIWDTMGIRAFNL